MERRPLKSREKKWAQALARWLAKVGAKPNQISLASIVFALLCGVCFLLAAGGVYFLLAAAFIQLRLLCNMLDGMVAIEGKLQSKTGLLYNEIPDRVADAAILVCAGYAAPLFTWGPVLGWTAALLAVLTAYVRVLGGAAGTAQYFSGPMAKPHRMAVLTVASVLSSLEVTLGVPPYLLTLGLVVIVLGSLITCVRRTAQIARELSEK